MSKKLKECKDCEKQVSIKAKTCPNCGTPNPTKYPVKYDFGATPYVFNLLIGIIFFIAGKIFLALLIIFFSSMIYTKYGKEFIKNKLNHSIGYGRSVTYQMVLLFLILFLIPQFPQSKSNIQSAPVKKVEKSAEQILQEKIESEKIAEQILQEKIESNFSGLDGSHIYLKRFVKENLKDPDSFEHIETGYKKRLDQGGKFNNVIMVIMKYRAKNSFGGYVVEYISADYDLDGNLVKMDSLP